jgi:hypothetical protein
MASVRTVRPTDLVALVASGGRVYPNEAVTRDRVGTAGSPHPLETALEQWFSFATGRHTWISVKGATLRGLASARKRGSQTAWELDCLIHTEDEPGVLTSVLDRVVEDAGRAGAEKVFLRLEAGSDSVRTAASAGFVPYLHERLLAARGTHEAEAPARDPGAGYTLRPRARADAHALFRLYNHATPETVRSAEAVTFREWLGSRERVSANRARQWVVEAEGGLVAWLRAGADGELGRFDLLVDPATPELTLAPEFATGLLERLEQRGFEERGRFVVLAKRTTRPLAAAELAPASAQTHPA